jgi:hypothetical protein
MHRQIHETCAVIDMDDVGRFPNCRYRRRLLRPMRNRLGILCGAKCGGQAANNCANRPQVELYAIAKVPNNSDEFRAMRSSLKLLSKE